MEWYATEKTNRETLTSSGTGSATALFGPSNEALVFFLRGTVRKGKMIGDS